MQLPSEATSSDLAKIAASSQENLERLLGYGERRFRPTYQISDYLDEKKFELEMSQISEEIMSAHEPLKELTSFQPTNKNEAHMLAQWGKTEKRLDQLLNYSNQLNDERGEASEGRISMTQKQVSVNMLLSAVTSLMYAAELEKKRKFATYFIRESMCRPYFDIWEYAINGETQIQIGGATLRDFKDNNSMKHKSPVSLYRFIVESMLIRYRCAHDKALVENQGQLQSEYPNSTKHQIEIASGIGMAIGNLFPEQLDLLIVQNQGIAREAALSAKALLERVEALKSGLLKTLLDPTSPDFPALRDQIIDYFQQDKYAQVLALHKVGLHKTLNIYQAYRKAQEFIESGNNAGFYEELSKAIVKYTEDVPSIEGVLTAHDVSLFLDLEQDVTLEKVPQAQEFKQIIKRIFEMSSVREYTLTPEKVSWENMFSSEAVRLEFDQNRPLKFTISFPYESETGETDTVAASFDTAKDSFHWSFLPLPKGRGNTDIEKMYRTLLVVTKSALLEVQRQAEQTYNEKRRAKEVSMPMPEVKKPKREKPVKEEPKEERKRKRLQPLVSVQIESQEVVPAEQPGVKKIILLPKDDEFKKMTRRISSVDREIVKKGIERFNEKGLGEFKPLKSRSKKNGKRLQSLEIGTETGGTVRVLTTEHEFKASQQSFDIEDIKYRQDIYKKNLPH